MAKNSNGIFANTERRVPIDTKDDARSNWLPLKSIVRPQHLQHEDGLAAL
jgi:hypothetical protein